MIAPVENNQTPINDSSLLLWSLRTLTSNLQISRSQIYQLIQADRFPRPLKLGRSSRWVKSDIQKWLELQEYFRSHEKSE